MKILIIGAGSLGCLFGAKLALAGHSVFAYVSSRHRDHFLAEGLRLSSLQGETTLVPNFHLAPPLESFAVEIGDEMPEICIIATKTYSLDGVCKEYKPILDLFPRVVLLQNGLGNEAVVQKYFPNISLFRLITSNGAFMKTIGHVIHTGESQTFLCNTTHGEIDDKLPRDSVVEDFFTALTQAGFHPEWGENPLEIIWRKALINIGINAFGALTGLPNGSLLDVETLPDIITDTVKEALKIAKVLKIPLDLTFDYIGAVFTVIRATKGNKNSMLQDILKTGPTEIAYINGKIVEYGKEQQIPTPYNALLTALIRGLERSSSK